MTELATFHAGQKTHQAVLHQQLALEFGSADNPRIRDETGPEDRLAVSGVEAGRGEIRTASPGGTSVTPNLLGNGTVTDIHHRHVRLLQRGDGYAYTRRKETSGTGQR